MENSNLLSREAMKSLFGGQSASFGCVLTHLDKSCSSNNGVCQYAYCVINYTSYFKIGVCCDGELQVETTVICDGEIKCMTPPF